MGTAMSIPRIEKKPAFVVALVVLTCFFLSCTKKPQQAAADPNGERKPAAAANNVFTTPHGFKVQFEPATTAPQKK